MASRQDTTSFLYPDSCHTLRLNMTYRARARRALRSTAPLGLLAFWVAVPLAASRYPTEYDWRYMTLSSLVYRDRNPDGYLWARAGLALCGMAGLYWTALRIRARKRQSAAPLSAATGVIGLGYLGMTCCALLPAGQLRIPRGHDLLALMGFVGLCAGLVLTTFEVARLGATVNDLPAAHRLRTALLSALALSPILLAAATQAYVSHALPGLPWVGLSWRARGVPVYLSFAFWEWVACAVFSIYVLVLSGRTPVERDFSCDR
jgi:hypothetical protein